MDFLDEFAELDDLGPSAEESVPGATEQRDELSLLDTFASLPVVTPAAAAVDLDPHMMVVNPEAMRRCEEIAKPAIRQDHEQKRVGRKKGRTRHNVAGPLAEL